MSVHKWGQNLVKPKKVAHEVQLSVSVMFQTYFDISCGVFLLRPTATWNVFVLRDKKGCVVNGDVIYASVLSSIKMCALFSLSYKFNLIAELKIYHLHSHEAFNTAGHSKQYA